MKANIILLSVFVFIQNKGFSSNDTLTSLSFDNFISIVIEHHPIAVKAELKTAFGDAAVLKSKGGFDPKLQADVAQKYFDGKQYYSLIDGGLKIPTWFGVDFKAGYEVNDGQYLNDQNRTPENGLIYAGISIPLGQGLLIDKRRAELKKAQLFQEATQLQRRVMINNLMLEAGMVYWNWYRMHKELIIYKTALLVAEDRLNAVNKMANIGERPFVDTIEAGLQVQNRRIQFQQAELNFSNASALLSIYLWSEGTVPLEITESIQPEEIEGPMALAVDYSYYTIMDTLISQHPELGIYHTKTEQLGIQKKLNQEQLKPTLNLSYNPITESIGGNPFSTYSIDNYTWGLTFQMPILLREERGELKMTSIQIQETELDIINKKAELTYKATLELNAWKTVYEQIMLYEKTVNDYEQLLKGERKLFEVGESSLFMINARELSFIQSQRMLIELTTKNRIAELKTRYALGLLPTYYKSNK